MGHQEFLSKRDMRKIAAERQRTWGRAHNRPVKRKKALGRFIVANLVHRINLPLI